MALRRRVLKRMSFVKEELAYIFFIVSLKMESAFSDSFRFIHPNPIRVEFRVLPADKSCSEPGERTISFFMSCRESSGTGFMKVKIRSLSYTYEIPPQKFL